MLETDYWLGTKGYLGVENEEWKCETDEKNIDIKESLCKSTNKLL